MRKMKIMTFNLRFENDRDGENGWLYRRDLVIDLIGRYAPSILGTQEGTLNQLNYLEKNLPGYTIHIPPQRVLDEKSQYPTLFFHHDEFEPLEGEEFWLSKTPNLHLSKNWDSAFPRMMSYGLFKEKQTGRSFWALVTHLDHIGTEARRQQAGIICRWVREKREPIVLTGDFNDSPGSSIHETLTSAETALQDTWQLLGGEENERSMTTHAFDGIPRKSRIDWILVSPHFNVRDASIIRDHYDNRYPSDHFPYEVDLEWA
jgi:endonuclease/exonuclease/phosphatase family metal-dependent hydrolase